MIDNASTSARLNFCLKIQIKQVLCSGTLGYVVLFSLRGHLPLGGNIVIVSLTFTSGGGIASPHLNLAEVK